MAIQQESADAIRIADEIVRILTDAPLRTRMADAARAHGRPEAAMDIARDLLDLAGIPASPTKPRHVNGAPASAPPTPPLREVR